MSFNKFQNLLNELKADDSLFYCGKVIDSSTADDTFAYSYQKAGMTSLAKQHHANPGDYIFCTTRTTTKEIPSYEPGEKTLTQHSYQRKDVYIIALNDMIVSYGGKPEEAFNGAINEYPMSEPTEADQALYQAQTKEQASLAIADGARVNMMAPNGYTPLMQQAVEGHLDVVTYLVDDCQADVWAACKNTGASADMMADYQGHKKIAAALQQRKKNTPMPHSDEFKAGISQIIAKSLHNYKNQKNEIDSGLDNELNYLITQAYNKILTSHLTKEKQKQRVSMLNKKPTKTTGNTKKSMVLTGKNAGRKYEQTFNDDGTIASSHYIDNKANPKMRKLFYGNDRD